jgi:hypothetical protein
MTPESQRIAIAKACGWSEGTTGLWKDPDKSGYYACPDYLNDLNAMHEAEKVLTDAQMIKFERELGVIVCKFAMQDGPAYKIWHATAAQRAKAFLRTLGLWKYDQ